MSEVVDSSFVWLAKCPIAECFIANWSGFRVCDYLSGPESEVNYQNKTKLIVFSSPNNTYFPIFPCFINASWPLIAVDVPLEMVAYSFSDVENISFLDQKLFKPYVGVALDGGQRNKPSDGQDKD